MKRWLSMLLAACLCCGLLVGCGGGKSGANDKDTVNKSASKTASIREYSFEVPESWEEGENTADLQYFYPADAMLMIGYSEMNQSITDDIARKEFIDSFGTGMEAFDLVSESEQNVAGQQAYKYKMNISMADKDWKATMVVMECQGGVVSLLMSTLSNSEKNYDKEFESILSSLKLKSGAVAKGESQSDVADPEAIKEKVDVRAVPTLDGLMCVFITNNSDCIIDELSVQLNYKNVDGTTIDTDEDWHDMVLPGSTVVSRMDTPDSYDNYEMQTNIELGTNPKYENHAENVTVNSNKGDKCIIVEITNNSDVVLDEVEYIAVLYQGDNVVTVEYPQDVMDVPVGQTITEKVDTFSAEYDRFEIYLNQAHTFGL